MTTRITKLRGKNSLTTDVRSPALVLFPLCDERGSLSAVLCEPSTSSDEQLPENIFFAWLLDLPATIDARDAATAILLVAEHAAVASAATIQPEKNVSDSVVDSQRSGDPDLKLELRRMLEKVIEERSIDEPETLSGIISQVSKLDRE